MTPQLCQSVIVKMHSVADPRTGWPCTLSASTVLCGMHLCAHHDRYWRHRLARGEKVRIHPERTLPVDLAGPIAAMSPDEDLDDEPSGPPVRYEYLAELHCLACGRFVSKVVIAYPTAPIIIPERLRCSACGGRPILSGEIERRALDNPFANDPAPIHRVRSVRALA